MKIIKIKELCVNYYKIDLTIPGLDGITNKLPGKRPWAFVPQLKA